MVAASFAARKGADDNGPRMFNGTAYGGGIVTDHPWFSRVAFDLASTKVETKAPALYMHRDPVGVITEATVDGNIKISGSLFSDMEGEAGKIAAMADRGLEWQLSVGIFPGRVEEVQAGSSVKLNGQKFDGPLTVFRDNRVREVSFCPLGADHTTSAHVFSVIGGERRQPSEDSMDQAEHDRIVAALNLKIAEQTTTLAANATTIAANAASITALEAKFTAQETAARVTAIKGLFTATGKEFTDEKAKPYLAMSAESFAAVDTELREAAKNRKPGLPAALATQQAVAGAGGTAAADGPKTATEYIALADKYTVEQKALGRDVDAATAIAHVRQQFAVAA